MTGFEYHKKGCLGDGGCGCAREARAALGLALDGALADGDAARVATHWRGTSVEPLAGKKTYSRDTCAGPCGSTIMSGHARFCSDCAGTDKATNTLAAGKDPAKLCSGCEKKLASDAKVFCKNDAQPKTDRDKRGMSTTTESAPSAATTTRSTGTMMSDKKKSKLNAFAAKHGISPSATFADLETMRASHKAAKRAEKNARLGLAADASKEQRRAAKASAQKRALGLSASATEAELARAKALVSGSTVGEVAAAVAKVERKHGVRS